MGSKNLKAIAVRGTMGVQVAHPQELFDLCVGASCEGQSPGRSRLREWVSRRAQQAGFQFRLRKCGFCATPCAYIKAENVQAEDGTSTATAAFQCGGISADTRAASAIARSTTSDLGLNAWEIAYGIIPWLQMCKQRGLIDRVDELEIPVPDRPVEYLRDVCPGSGKFVQGLLYKLAFRDTEMGDILSQGACYAADQLFGGQGKALLDRIYPRRCGQTEHWAGHWGPGGSVYWPHWLPPVLQWCIDTRDPASDSTHQWTEHAMRYLEDNRSPRPGPVSPEQARHVAAKVYGNPDVFDSDITYERPEVKAIPAIWHSRRGMLVGSLVLCDREHSRVFSAESEDGVADTALMSKLFSACTGYDVDEQALDRAGERIWNQLRAVDVRDHGRDRAVDESTLDGFMYPAKDDGVMLDRERFQALLDSYYELSGWNPKCGWPTRSKLNALGLADVADELEDVGKLG
jgi:aldehyde:ferredoxin oxidoreductase